MFYLLFGCWDGVKCFEDAEIVLYPLMMISILNEKRKLSHKTVYTFWLIGTNFDPPQLSLDSTFNMSS